MAQEERRLLARRTALMSREQVRAGAQHEIGARLGFQEPRDLLGQVLAVGVEGDHGVEAPGQQNAEGGMEGHALAGIRGRTCTSAPAWRAASAVPSWEPSSTTSRSSSTARVRRTTSPTEGAAS